MSGVVAIILARAGSKGVPGKNSALVADRPCVCWTIDDARRAATVGRVALSTDDARLQELAVGLGVDVVARPAALATDDARVDDAARHALDEIERAGSDVPAVLVILYANVPVRPAGLIDACVRLVLETGADSAQSYTTVGKHHPWWTARIDGDTARVTPWEGDILNGGVHRRQDLPPAFIPDGGALAVRASVLKQARGDASPHAFLGADRRGVRTGEGEVIDIDSPIDLLVADAILRDRCGPSVRAGSAEGVGP